MRKQASKNVLLSSGRTQRIPLDRAEALLASGAAKRFVSNTIHRAMSLGIEVKDFDTRDEVGKLKARIVEARKLSKQPKQAD